MISHEMDTFVGEYTACDRKRKKGERITFYSFGLADLAYYRVCQVSCPDYKSKYLSPQSS